MLEDGDATLVTNPEDLAAVTGQPHSAPQQAGIRFVGHIRRTPHIIPIGSNITPNPPRGYDRAAWRSMLGITPATTLVAYFGLISPSKGLDVLLDALEQLPDTIRLLIIGGDSATRQDRQYADQLRERLQSSVLAGRVLVTGHCPPPEVSAHLLAADLGALPFADGATFRRGSLLAALAHGLPVVTTTSELDYAHSPTISPPSGVSLSEDPSTARQSISPRVQDVQNTIPPLPTLIDQQNVALIRVGDTQALAAQIHKLAHDHAQRATLAQGARALSVAFSWDTIADRHVALYQQLTQT